MYGLIRIMVFLGLSLAGFSLYQMGYRMGKAAQNPVFNGQQYQQLLAQKQELLQVQHQMQAHLDALAMRIARMKTHLMRLEALGQRLVKMGRLDEKEFNFNQPPAFGGDWKQQSRSIEVQELQQAMDKLHALIEDREHKLVLLQDLIDKRDLNTQVSLSGMPVKQGFITSSFGWRIDPLTGKRKMHKGIDFAGKLGEEVLAVAAGVVTKAEYTRGYGNVVEIRHANGYETRYAHNSELLVQVGEQVAKGEIIAKLGSTGRSTGPHVHFEVRHNGQLIDPKQFIHQKEVGWLLQKP